MTTLRYRGYHAAIEDLALNECTIRPCSSPPAPDWWELWFNVARETDGVPEVFAVAVRVGSYCEGGPQVRTWGLAKTGPGTWQVSPSINVLDTRDAHPGPHPTAGSLWHQTPAIVGVPDGEPWAKGEAP